MSILRLSATPRDNLPALAPVIIAAESNIVEGPSALKLYIFRVLAQRAAAASTYTPLSKLEDALPSIWEAVSRAEVMSDGKSIKLRANDAGADSVIGKIVNSPIHAAGSELQNQPYVERPWPHGPGDARGVRVFASEEEYNARSPHAPSPSFASGGDKSKRAYKLLAIGSVGLFFGFYAGLAYAMRNEL